MKKFQPFSAQCLYEFKGGVDWHRPVGVEPSISCLVGDSVSVGQKAQSVSFTGLALYNDQVR